MQLLHLMPVVVSSGCRQLTDEVQARLALSFANCFLIRSGLRSYNCDKDTPVSECLKDVDSNAFTAYSNFFTVSISNISIYFSLGLMAREKKNYLITFALYHQASCLKKLLDLGIFPEAKLFLAQEKTQDSR